jgi:cytochrome b pre-mRNA-processing protein 3
MPLASLFRRNPHRSAAHTAYTQIVARAREPAFFLDCAVPDTLDGRFELIALHAFLVLNRLKADHAATADFAQELFDAMFADLDRGLREMGASDIGVGRHVKEMAKSFYGRIVAYEHGLASADEQLGEALRRNLYGTASPPPEAVAAMARYVRLQAAALAREMPENMLLGQIKFSPFIIENE